MSEIKLPVRYDHSSSLLIEADGGPIADCLTNHEIGEQIAAALNATLTEQLAEAKARIAELEQRPVVMPLDESQDWSGF